MTNNSTNLYVMHHYLINEYMSTDNKSNNLFHTYSFNDLLYSYLYRAKNMHLVNKFTMIHMIQVYFKGKIFIQILNIQNRVLWRCDFN